MNDLNSLVFVSNLVNVVSAGGNNFTLTYRYYTYTIPTPVAIPATPLTLTLIGNSAILYLATNFVPIPLCNPKNNEKYVSGLVCSPIVSCSLATLNAVYCRDENIPFVCSNNFYFDPLTQKCSSSCSGSAPRSPGSVSTNAICNFQCLNNSLCPTASVTEISNLSTNYICNTGFNRIGYKCTNANAVDSNIK